MADGVAIVTTERPNASDTPRSPMPTCGNPDAITALPQPAKVSQNVPMASAISFCDCIVASLICRAFGADRRAPAKCDYGGLPHRGQPGSRLLAGTDEVRHSPAIVEQTLFMRELGSSCST
jgi:hypothetical protein